MPSDKAFVTTWIIVYQIGTLSCDLQEKLQKSLETLNTGFLSVPTARKPKCSKTYCPPITGKCM